MVGTNRNKKKKKKKKKERERFTTTGAPRAQPDERHALQTALRRAIREAGGTMSLVGGRPAGAGLLSGAGEVPDEATVVDPAVDPPVEDVDPSVEDVDVPEEDMAGGWTGRGVRVICSWTIKCQNIFVLW